MDVKKKLSEIKTKATDFVDDHSEIIAPIAVGLAAGTLSYLVYTAGLKRGFVSGFRFCDVLMDRITQHDPATRDKVLKLISDHGMAETEKLTKEW